MTSKMIPVQGTFDIAKGRHILRDYIISEQLPHYFIIRSVALLTTFGETVLIVNAGRCIPIYVDINREESGDINIKLYCNVPGVSIEERHIQHIEQRFNLTSDNAQIVYHNNHLDIEANIHLSHNALI